MGIRASSVDAPLSLRTSGVDVTPELREHVHSRMDRRLGKFARHIGRLTVRFEDVNGPRGGVDKICRIKVVLTGLESILVEQLASDAFEAVNRADGRVERAVRLALGRARGRGLLTSPRARARRAPAGAPVRATARASARATSRNFKRRTRRASAALEVSAKARPSRKSTRKSVNRTRQGNKLTRRQVRRVSSPKARLARSKKR